MSRCCCTSQNRDRDCPIHGDDPPRKETPRPPKESKPLDVDPTTYDVDELKALPTVTSALGWDLKRDDGRVRVWLGAGDAVQTEELSSTGGNVKHRVTPLPDGFYFILFLPTSRDWEIGEVRGGELYGCGDEEALDLAAYETGPRIEMPELGAEPWLAESRERDEVDEDARDVCLVRDELSVAPEAAKAVVLRCAGCSRTYTGDNDDCPHCGNTDVSEVVKGPE